MKSEIVKDLKPKEMTYPYVGITSDKQLIVLFDKPGCGVSLWVGSDLLQNLGVYVVSWVESDFIPWSGIIKFES